MHIFKTICSENKIHVNHRHKFSISQNFNEIHKVIYLCKICGFLFIVYNFTSIWDQRVYQTKGRSWRTYCPLVLVACHKLGQGDCVRSLHEPSKSARVGEEQGRTKAFLNFLCIWTDKEQMFFILYLPQVIAQQSFFAYGTPFHTPNIILSCVLPHRN